MAEFVCVGSELLNRNHWMDKRPKKLVTPAKRLSMTTLLLVIIFIIAVAYRFFYFPENIYFGYDQARDAYESQRIFRERDLVLLGPRTEVDGVFHSPLYYYIVGPLYLLAGGSPSLPAVFLLLVNAFGVFLIFWIGVVLFSRPVGLIAAVVYALSFEQYQYAYYLSHPSLATTVLLVFYLGLALVAFRASDWGWYVAAIGLALSIHFELLLLYLVPTFIVAVYLFRMLKSTHRPSSVVGAVILVIGLLSNFAIVELQYNFRASRSLATFVMQSTQRLEILPVLGTSLQKYILHFYLNIFGYSLPYSAFLLFVAAVLLLRPKHITRPIGFLLLWMFSPLSLSLSASQPVSFFFTNMGVSSAIILLTAYGITRVHTSLSVRSILVTVVLSGNVFLWLHLGKSGLVNGWLAVQEGMMFSDEMAALDYTYASADRRPFKIKTLTMPLKIQTTWSYLYMSFGLPRYGYLPAGVYDDVLGFHGHFPKSDANICLRYLISEPTRGIANWFTDEFYDEERGTSTLVEEKTFGSISVQKRLDVGCAPHSGTLSWR